MNSGNKIKNRKKSEAAEWGVTGQWKWYWEGGGGM